MEKIIELTDRKVKLLNTLEELLNCDEMELVWELVNVQNSLTKSIIYEKSENVEEI